MEFLNFGFIDLIDIFLVALLLYTFYQLIKGTVALNIMLGLFAFVICWLIIKALNMELMSNILDNLVNVGVLALIIVFQQEIRRMFLHFGSKYNLFHAENSKTSSQWVADVVAACENMATNKTGALIVVAQQAKLVEYVGNGEKISAQVSSRLIESLFFKNNPLHDGALIIVNNTIEAAACILPLSENNELPNSMGLRHRAALGITELTDAIAIVTSEERGEITLFIKSNYFTNLSRTELENRLLKI